MKTKVPFVWTEEAEKGFQYLRDSLMHDSLLKYPDFTKAFILTTDASGYAMGAILSQKFNGHTFPIAYASQQLNAAEQNYSATERECLAIIWAIKHFHCYLYGRPFQVITDHRPLKWLMSVKDPTSRLARWNLKLQAYDFEIIHRPGKQQTHVDALSRVVMTIHCDPKVNEESEASPILNRYYIKQEQLKDAELKQKIQTLNEGNTLGTYFLDEDKILYRKESVKEPGRHECFEQLIVPPCCVNDILRAYHDAPYAGHQGPGKTWRKLKRAFYWKGMRKDIENYIHSCPSCQARKGHGKCHPPLHPLHSITTPFERISMDILGPVTISSQGSKYILVVIDHLTRYVEVFPLPDQTAETVAKVFATKIVLKHGTPKQLNRSWN